MRFLGLAAISIILFVQLTSVAQEAGLMSDVEQALVSGEFERVEQLLIEKRDKAVGSALDSFDREKFITGYRHHNNGSMPSEIAIQGAKDISDRLKDRILRDAARYSHMLGLNASMQLQHKKAVGYFEEAVRYDPGSTEYADALRDAQREMER